MNRMNQDNATSPWRNTDNAQLLFGADLTGTTIGLAGVGTMCSRSSAGIVQVSFCLRFYNSSIGKALDQ